MDLEKQRPKPTEPQKKVSNKVAGEITSEVTEGMTERDHRSNDFKDSPLKIFMSTEIFLLIAGLIVGAIYYFFFRDI